MKNPIAFVFAVATGLARRRESRRRVMFALTLVSLVILFAGATVLWASLAARPLAFVLYWFACGWITLCVILLAIYDILDVMAQCRRDRSAARRRIFKDLP
jgi:hypothetical protein